MAYQELSNIYDGYWLTFSRLYKKFIKAVQAKHNFKMDKILDIGCGTGSLVYMLSNNDNEITGLDISAYMIEKARIKCKDNKNIEFYHGDFRDFKINKEFDLVLCCYDSLNHVKSLEDIELVFQRVKDHLAEKGFFIFDIVTEKYFINANNDSIENYEYKEKKYNNKISYDAERKVFKSAFVFENSFDEHEEIPIEYEQINKYIQKYNFEIREVFSDFYLNEINNDTERYYFVLQNK